MVLAAGLLIAVIAASPADVTGKWEGKLIAHLEDGTTREEPTLMILHQKDRTISGSVGRDEADRHPITSGTINGDKISLVARNAQNDQEYRIELTLDRDELKGTVTTGERRVDIVLKKRKD